MCRPSLRVLLLSLALGWVLWLSLGGRARADDAAGFALDRFDPPDRGSDWFQNDSLDLRGNLRPALGLTYDWSYKPFVLRGSDGGERAVVVRDQILLHVGGSLILVDRFRFGVGLPVLLYENGDDLSLQGPKPSPDFPGIGDVRVSSVVRMFGEFGDVVTGAIGVRAFFPTGRRALLTSDGQPRLLLDATLAGTGEGFVYSAHGGFQERPLHDEVLGRALGSELVFGAAFGVKVNDLFVFGPELVGSKVVTGSGTDEARGTLLEALLGFHVALGDEWRFGSGLGRGITGGDGAPVLRVLATIDYAPDYCVDKDGDGICARADACPTVAGVPTADPKTNGCPADRDRDGFFDADDACPDVPGVKTGDPKTTGCPDRDHDGVPDQLDACPDQAGVSTSDPKTNGCRKLEPTASVQGPEVQTSEPVRFVGASAELDPASTPMLEAIAKLLTTEAKLHVVIDPRVVSVPEAERPALARKRAEVVRAWLVAHGIEGSRLLVPTAPPKRAPGEEPSADRVDLHVEEQMEPTAPPLD